MSTCRFISSGGKDSGQDYRARGAVDHTTSVEHQCLDQFCPSDRQAEVMPPGWQISGPVSDNAIYRDLMRRTTSCASVLPFTGRRDRTTLSFGSKSDLPADPSRHVRSMIRDGMVKAQQSSHTTKEAAVSTKAVRTSDPTS